MFDWGIFFWLVQRSLASETRRCHMTGIGRPIRQYIYACLCACGVALCDDSLCWSGYIWPKRHLTVGKLFLSDLCCNCSVVTIVCILLSLSTALTTRRSACLRTIELGLSELILWLGKFSGIHGTGIFSWLNLFLFLGCNNSVRVSVAFYISFTLTNTPLRVRENNGFGNLRIFMYGLGTFSPIRENDHRFLFEPIALYVWRPLCLSLCFSLHPLQPHEFAVSISREQETLANHCTTVRWIGHRRTPTNRNMCQMI